MTLWDMVIYRTKRRRINMHGEILFHFKQMSLADDELKLV
jgi:hypothetical protein